MTSVLTRFISAIAVLGILFTLFSCCKYEKDIRTVLHYAGNNREELEKVLEYYRNTDCNNLKYKAAEYLIKNMTLHKSYPAELYMDYARELDSLFTNETSPKIIVQKTEEISEKYRPRMKAEYDIRTITADYLIWNIEYSFRLRETSTFLYHLDFNEFCEYVLPYKCVELQPITRWKEKYNGVRRGNLDVMTYLHDLKYNARKAVEVIQVPMADKVFTGTRPVDCIELVDMSAMMNMQVGTCYERSILGMMNCRSKGIPVSLDMVPNWGDRQDPHFWNNVNMENNRNIAYSPFTYNPGDANNLDRVYAKVYRYSYKPDPVMLDAIIDDGFLPRLFSNPFLKDVTAEYAKTTDISIRIQSPKKTESKYAYLCVFNKDWQPIAVTKIKHGKAEFLEVGVGVLYLIVSYQDGEARPLSKPFFVNLKGEISEITIDKSRTTDLHITRKFPAFRHIFKIYDKLGSFTISASNSMHFSKSDILCSTPENELFSGQFTQRDTTAKRFWKIGHHDNDICYLAAIYFHDADTDSLLTANIVNPCSDSDGNPSSNLTDEKLLSYYALRKESEDIIFDFGQPVRIGRITYIKRGDGNNIRHGDTYELYYWDDGWILHDRQLSKDISLDFKGLPSDALYYIKCVTRGKQNRIFTYQDGEPRWY